MLLTLLPSIYYTTAIIIMLYRFFDVLGDFQEKLHFKNNNIDGVLGAFILLDTFIYFWLILAIDYNC